MAGTLILPTTSKPLNLSLPHDAQATYVDADMYGICERIREISPRLMVVLLTHERTGTYSYAIMEDCEDGEARLVFKVKELDGRVLDRLRYIMSVPFAQRVAECEADCYRFEQEEAANADAELYEKLGGPMLLELERCGFIQRPKSFAKRGHVGGKGSLRKELAK